jgi:hypothetical protein
MVYVLQKFKHYLLGNKFVFYIDHMALLYLVKKPQLLSQIMRCLLLFLEYDFLVVYKPRLSHLMTMLSHNFLMLQKIRKCLIELLMHNYLYFNRNGLQEVYTYISIRNFLVGYSMKQRKIWCWRCCPLPSSMESCINKGKINFCANGYMIRDFGNHRKDAWRSWWHTFSVDIIARKVLNAKYWWPILHEDAQ